MLKLVFKDKVIIDTKLSKYIYTYQIMGDLRKKYNDLYLIIGADNIVNFDKWKNVQNILENYVIVIKRNDIDMEGYINNFKEKDKFIIINNFSFLDISSTYIRSMIRKGKYDKISQYLNKDVLKYIRDNNLYL